MIQNTLHFTEYYFGLLKKKNICTLKGIEFTVFWGAWNNQNTIKIEKWINEKEKRRVKKFSPKRKGNELNRMENHFMPLNWFFFNQTFCGMICVKNGVQRTNGLCTRQQILFPMH